MDTPDPEPDEQEKILNMLREAKPSWQKDGLGLRGDRPETREQGNMQFESKVVFRRPEVDLGD